MVDRRPPLWAFESGHAPCSKSGSYLAQFRRRQNPPPNAPERHPKAPIEPLNSAIGQPEVPLFADQSSQGGCSRELRQFPGRNHPHPAWYLRLKGGYPVSRRKCFDPLSPTAPPGGTRCIQNWIAAIVHSKTRWLLQYGYCAVDSSSYSAQ
jgi:hypothetical protein